jgi:hypothetical protein
VPALDGEIQYHLDRLGETGEHMLEDYASEHGLGEGISRRSTVNDNSAWRCGAWHVGRWGRGGSVGQRPAEELIAAAAAYGARRPTRPSVTRRKKSNWLWQG